MMSKKRPQLRFEGFTDDWEERKIKDIFKITRGQVLAATETSEEKSDISPFPVYSSQTKNNGLMGYYKDYLFDTAITWTTDGANAGTVSYRSGRFYSTNVNGVLISDKGYTNKAISEILNLEAWKWVSHVGNPKLMNNVMGDISIMIPSSFEEQDRLSDFLNQLDDTIALHQHKLDLLKEQKKGFLQKMFPKNGAKVPELRFAGFVDDWEQRKLSDLMTFSNGINAPKENYGKGTKMISVMDILNPLPIKYDNILNSVSVDKKIEDKNKVENGDLIFVRSSEIVEEVGWAKAYKEARYALYSGFAIRGKRISSYNAYFIELTLNYANRKEIERRAGGSTRFNVSQEILNSLTVLTPSISEQNQIDLFFTKIDDTITLHQHKLDLLKEQKKGFLQKMFV